MKSFLKVIAQIAVWSAFVFSPFIFMPRPQGSRSISIENFNFLTFAFTNSLFIVYYYVSYYLLIPKLFIQRRFIIYALCTITCLAIILSSSGLSHLNGEHRHIYAISDISGSNIQPPIDDLRAHAFIHPQYITLTMLFILISLASLGIKMTSQWRLSEQEKQKPN